MGNVEWPARIDTMDKEATSLKLENKVEFVIACTRAKYANVMKTNTITMTSIGCCDTFDTASRRKHNGEGTRRPRECSTFPIELSNSEK